MNGFAHREVPRLGRRLFRLGLSGSFGLDEAGCRETPERLQYVFWSPRMKALTPALRDALARDRDRYVVSAGPLFGYFPGAVPDPSLFGNPSNHKTNTGPGIRQTPACVPVGEFIMINIPIQREMPSVPE